jgi:hypothetical protein
MLDSALVLIWYLGSVCASCLSRQLVHPSHCQEIRLDVQVCLLKFLHWESLSSDAGESYSQHWCQQGSSHQGTEVPARTLIKRKEPFLSLGILTSVSVSQLGWKASTSPSLFNFILYFPTSCYWCVRASRFKILLDPCTVAELQTFSICI